MRAWLLQKVHISWHIAWAALGVVGGIAVAPWLPLGLISPAMIVAAGGLFLIVVLKRWRIMAVVALTSGLFLGAWRGGSEQHALLAYQVYYGQTLQVRGQLAEDPSMGVRGDQRLQLKNIHVGNKAMPGQIWLSTPSRQDIKRGDIVYAYGRLGEGFGSLAATMFRAHLKKIERPHPGDVARQARDWFANGARAAVPDPQASLGLGYLTGQRSALPVALDEQLRIVGLTHAVVASGYNLTILVVFARQLFSKISKYLSAFSAGLMIIGFMLMTGFSPSMSRAGLVAGLGLIAWYYGRKLHPLVLLPFAAAVTVLFNPAYVWGDVGWYLSFTAFAGVLVLAPLFEVYFWGRDPPPKLAQLLTETIAASLATLPIILYCFGLLPSYALIANMLVLPLVPLAMLLTFVAGLAGVFVPDLAEAAGLPAYWLLKYMTWVVERVAGLPGAQVDFRIDGLMLVGGYAMLSLLSVYMFRKTKFVFRTQDRDTLM